MTAKTLSSPVKIESSGAPASMKMIICMIRQERLDAVKDAIDKLNLVGGVTVVDVRGAGRQKGSADYHKGIPYSVRFNGKVRLEIVVPAHDAPRVITLVSQLAYTGKVGDGKIFEHDVLAALRIRTGERDLDAL